MNNPEYLTHISTAAQKATREKDREPKERVGPGEADFVPPSQYMSTPQKIIRKKKNFKLNRTTVHVVTTPAPTVLSSTIPPTPSIAPIPPINLNSYHTESLKITDVPTNLLNILIEESLGLLNSTYKALNNLT